MRGGRVIRALRRLLRRRPRITYVDIALGAPRPCDTCLDETRQPVYAWTDDPTAAIQIGTYCPNCLPQEDS